MGRGRAEWVSVMELEIMEDLMGRCLRLVTALCKQHSLAAEIVQSFLVLSEENPSRLESMMSPSEWNPT